MVPIARAILREHKRKPISGSGMMIGRQTIPMTPAEAIEMCRQEGVTLRTTETELDHHTGMGKGRGFISDLSFFRLFSDIKFRTLDVTDYENAEIVHDMHLPVPPELHNQFDFIWPGSCLDNMFDPAQAMKSITKMLKPGGRALHMEIGSAHFDAYVMFSQAWFFDYCAINNFEACQVYSALMDPPRIWEGPYDIYMPTNWRDATRQFPAWAYPKKALLTFAFVEKGENTTSDLMPIQKQYRPDQKPYQEAFARFNEARKILVTTDSSFAPARDRPGFVHVAVLDQIASEYRMTPPSTLGHKLKKAIANPKWALSRAVAKLP